MSLLGLSTINYLIKTASMLTLVVLLNRKKLTSCIFSPHILLTEIVKMFNSQNEVKGFILFLVGHKIIDVPVIVNKTTTVDSIKVESSLRFFSKTFSNSTNKASATSCPNTGRIIVTNDSVFGSESDLILSGVNVVFQSNLNLTGGNIFIDNCSTLESREDINIIRGKENLKNCESLLQQATNPFAVF